jgi:hypothetical protein
MAVAAHGRLDRLVALGDADAAPDVADLVALLAWQARQLSSTGSGAM